MAMTIIGSLSGSGGTPPPSAPTTRPAPPPGSIPVPKQPNPNLPSGPTSGISPGPVSDPNVPYQGRDGTAVNVPVSTQYGQPAEMSVGGLPSQFKINPLVLVFIGLGILILRGTFK